jgi:ppGpp synthetase/RelA/SpoT-type nucleotidyltranferase
MTFSEVGQRPTESSAAPTFGHCAADFTRFVSPYRLAISVLRTKLAILKHDFADLGRSCPIESVSWRVKRRDRIVGKAQRLHGHAHRNGSTPSARAGVRSQAIPSTM